MALDAKNAVVKGKRAEFDQSQCDYLDVLKSFEQLRLFD